MADEQTQGKKQKLPHQQVSPLWYAQNLALLGVGTGIGYGAGATAAHLVTTQGGMPSILGRMDPKRRDMLFRGAGALAGAGSAFALSHARNAMEQRLHEKMLEREEASKKPRAPTPLTDKYLRGRPGWAHLDDDPTDLYGELMEMDLKDLHEQYGGHVPAAVMRRFSRSGGMKTAELGDGLDQLRGHLARQGVAGADGIAVRVTDRLTGVVHHLIGSAKSGSAPSWSLRALMGL